MGCDQAAEFVEKGFVRREAVKAEALVALGDDLRGVGSGVCEQHERAVEQFLGGYRGEGLRQPRW